MLESQTRLADFLDKTGIKRTSLMDRVHMLGIRPCGYITSEVTKRPSYIWNVSDLELAAKYIGSPSVRTRTGSKKITHV